ncbi:MAG: hypothetical protein KIT44_07980 [Opitutaceae bacterium]|nr:hypothetical protein [Opitutaceae bacterium]
MKTLLFILSAYFFACFVLRAIRYATTHMDLVFNTPAANIGAMIEYGALSAVCLTVAILG